MKHFDNGDLRASGDAEPKVVRQIETYSRLLRENRNAVIDSYRRVCCNLLGLRGLEERYATLEGIANNSRELLVDEDPVLIVFGFDADQKDGANWRPHREKLAKKLGKERVILKGGSKKLVHGISV